jgi:hypothetical protein
VRLIARNCEKLVATETATQDFRIWRGAVMKVLAFNASP